MWSICFTHRIHFPLLGICIVPQLPRGFPGGLTVKNSPVMQESQETQILSVGWEGPLEEGMATHPSILAWRIPMERGAWKAIVHGVAKSQTR